VSPLGGSTRIVPPGVWPRLVCVASVADEPGPLRGEGAGGHATFYVCAPRLALQGPSTRLGQIRNPARGERFRLFPHGRSLTSSRAHIAIDPIVPTESSTVPAVVVRNEAGNRFESPS
jgi:hypothetical protein